MSKVQKLGKVFLFFYISHSLPKVFCGLQPYYLNFPSPVLSVPNEIGDFSYSIWPQKNNETSTRTGNLPSGPIPLVFHTWIKPDNSEGTKLQNGTVVYYLGGPWGGIRSSPPMGTSDKPLPQVTPVSNSISVPISSGWAPPLIDITTPPPPSRQQSGPWGHGHFGFGWPSSTQLYDKIPETTSAPARSQLINSSTTPTTAATTATTTTVKSTTTTGTARTSATTRASSPALRVETTTTTVDPIAENANSRFPVSDSVRKFRRIIAQIRTITKKELGAESREARREQRRRERLLRNRSQY